LTHFTPMIYFNNSTFKWQELSQLTKEYQEFSSIEKFISSWQSGAQFFDFKTSGATGNPKQVVISRAQIEASVRATKKHLSLSADDVSLLSLSPKYIAAMMMALRSFVLKMDMILLRPNSNPAKYLKNGKATFASFVPLQIYQMIDSGDISALAGIRNVLIGGAPLHRSAYEVLSKIPANIYLTYGMTETVSHIALKRIRGKFESSHFQVLPDIEIGTNPNQCLTIKGAVTNNEKLETNDLINLIDATQFDWLGRADQVINSGGIKIVPETIEQIVEDTIGDELQGDKFFIGGLDDAKLGQKAVLFVEGTGSTKNLLGLLKKPIETAHDRYHVPKSVIYIRRFERTESGKVKRRLTIEKYRGEND